MNSGQVDGVQTMDERQSPVEEETNRKTLGGWDTEKEVVAA